jgi:4-hydroxybenzoate polyprenyltransferase
MTEEQRLLSGTPAERVVAPTPASAGRSRAALQSRAFPRVALHLWYVFRSMRPRQWTKNLIVYMALLFSINEDWQVSDPSSWASLVGWSTVAFALFCMISSAEYLVNDVVDRERPAHPKAKRPSRLAHFARRQQFGAIVLGGLATAVASH